MCDLKRRLVKMDVCAARLTARWLAYSCQTRFVTAHATLALVRPLARSLARRRRRYRRLPRRRRRNGLS